MAPRAIPSLLLLALLLLFSAPAFSQSPPAAVPAQAAASSVPNHATQPNLRALLDTLNNDKTRVQFLAKLRALVDSGVVAQPTAPKRQDWLSEATTSLGAFSGSVIAILAEIETLPGETAKLFHSLTDPFVIERIGWAAATVAGVLAAALLAEISRQMATPASASHDRGTRVSRVPRPLADAGPSDGAGRRAHRPVRGRRFRGPGAGRPEFHR